MKDGELTELFKKTYLSDIIFRQHFDSMNMINITVVILQTTVLILGVLLKIIFNITSIWMVFVTISLLIMQIISSKILRRNWEKAKKRLKIYDRITEDINLK